MYNENNDIANNYENQVANARKHEEVNSNSAAGRALESSQSEEEDCDEDEETNPATSNPSTPPSEETGSTWDDCQSEEDGVSSNTESPESTSESNAWPATDDNVVTTSTRTTQRMQKPRDPNRSSGSFHDSNSVGVDFSDSASAESKGRSTEFRENFTD